MEKKKLGKTLIVLDILIALIFLALVGFVIYSLLIKKDKKENASSESISESLSKLTSESDTESVNIASPNEASDTDAEPEFFSLATPADAYMEYSKREFKKTENTVELESSSVKQAELQEQLNAEWQSAVTDEEKQTVLNKYSARIPVDESGNPTGETPIVTYYNLLRLTPSENAAYPATSNLDNNQAIVSRYALLVDLDTNEIVAQRDSEDQVIVPASMTKVLTALTAADYLTEDNLDDEYIMPQDIIDYCIDQEASRVGYLDGEPTTVRDMFYGMLVTSGADATLGLVNYVAGSEEDFMKLMNQKARELGLSEEANFTNPIGLYDPDLHCTMSDMAKIMAAATENPLCADAMQQKTYVTIPWGEELPEGITICNEFVDNILIQLPANGLGAKTGYVDEGGFCAASFLKTESGKTYVLVTADCNSKWRVIHDHVSLYRSYTY